MSLILFFFLFRNWKEDCKIFFYSYFFFFLNWVHVLIHSSNTRQKKSKMLLKIKGNTHYGTRISINGIPKNVSCKTDTMKLNGCSKYSILHTLQTIYTFIKHFCKCKSIKNLVLCDSIMKISHIQFDVTQ